MIPNSKIAAPHRTAMNGRYLRIAERLQFRGMSEIHIGLETVRLNRFRNDGRS
jgi:hypothetical protein